MPSIFNLTIPQLRDWSRRQLPDHRQLNEPVQAFNQLITGISTPRMKAGLPIPRSMTVQFKLHLSAATYADHLVCRTWNEVTESAGTDNILVAKPWLLRRKPFDDKVREGVRYEYSNGVTRTAYDAADETGQLQREEQIHPRYLIDDVIMGISVEPGVLKVDGIDVLFLDINVDGRGWRTYYEWL